MKSITGEDGKEVNYIDLPSNIQAQISGKEYPDYSHIDLDKVSTELDFVAENTDESRNFLDDPNWRGGSLRRRAYMSMGKGLLYGAIFGSGLSLMAKRINLKTWSLPISFHVYLIGGSAFMGGMMNMCVQTRRYIRYMNYKNTSEVDANRADLEVSKEAFGKYLEKGYNRKLVEAWKNDVEGISAIRSNVN